MNSDTVDLIATIIFFASVPPAFLFPLLYGIRSAWRETRPGRALFWFSTAMAAIYTLLFPTLIFGSDYWGREWLRLVAYTFLTFNLWRLLYALLKEQARTDMPPEERIRERL